MLSAFPLPSQSIANTGAAAASGARNVTEMRAPAGTHCSGMQKARVTCSGPPCCNQNRVAVIAPASLRTTAVAVLKTCCRFIGRESLRAHAGPYYQAIATALRVTLGAI